MSEGMRDYSLPGDPYGIAAEYTTQSAAVDVSSSIRQDGRDVRGNSILSSRSVPTQAEADAIVEKSKGCSL